MSKEENQTDLPTIRAASDTKMSYQDYIQM